MKQLFFPKGWGYCSWSYGSHLHSQLLRLAEADGWKSIAFDWKSSGKYFQSGPSSFAGVCQTSEVVFWNKGAKSLNRCLWQLLPKHHFMMHMLETTRETRVNPKFFTLLCGESFMGIISRMARLVHRSTVSKRVAERYLAKIGLFIRLQFKLSWKEWWNRSGKERV